VHENTPQDNLYIRNKFNEKRQIYNNVQILLHKNINILTCLTAFQMIPVQKCYSFNIPIRKSQKSMYILASNVAHMFRTTVLKCVAFMIYLFHLHQND